MPYSNAYGYPSQRQETLDYIWNPVSLSWEAMTQPLVKTDTLNVNADVTFPASQTVDGEVSVSNFPGSYPVTGTFWQTTQPVSGNFYPATQPVSAASLPLPSGAATSVAQATLESLIETLQELNHRLAPLGGAISMVGGQALRVNTGGSTFAVSGPILATDYHIAGRNWPIAMALHNATAQANINNVTGA